MFEYCFLPDDGKKILNTQVTCLENTDQTEGECTRKYKPRRHSSVHEQVSLLIIKIVVMCRNIQRQGYVVFGEFFLN